MNIKTIWTDEIKRDDIKILNKNINVDVLIIGGGITGLSTAYHLINSGLKVCLVERDIIGCGTTSKTTGKITYLQDLIYQKISLYNNKDKAKIYLKSQKEAISIIKNIIKKYNISCDFLKVNSYVYTNNNKNIKKLTKEYQFFKDNNIKINSGEKLPIDIKSKFYISVNDTYVFHPMKYLNKLKQICEENDIKVYENTNVIKCEKNSDSYLCKTDNNTIKAKKVVFASHYPYFTVPFLMPIKSYIEKSYIVATKVDNKIKVSGITNDKTNFSFRSHSDKQNNYLICLGKSHNLREEKDDNKMFNNLCKENKIINNPLYEWTNHDIITSDYLPYIGKINKSDNLFIATGYNTWGMTNGTIAGKVISDLIMNKNNEYVDLFNPNRDMNLGKIINTPNNIYSSIKAILKTKIKTYNNNTVYKIKDGKNVATYNNYHIKNTCPHLKCGLIFNNKEKTWDCPCHGSRFDLNGKCINGPSKYDIK